MNASFVLTLIGPDRLGLVESLSRTLTAHGANWLESRMARLAGKFAGILSLEVPDDNAAALLDALRALEKEGLVIVAERSDAAGGEERNRARLDLTGQDRPGIVREVSQVLARLGVSVDDLTTSSKSAPMTGETLFLASAELHLPPGVDVDQVRRSLEGIAQDLMVDVTIE